jgi:uncharacterized membrane protein
MAVLTNQNTLDTHTRSFVKGVSWRVVGTIDTIVLSFMVTGNAGHALRIGLTEVLTKIILYYLHERAWNAVAFGRTKDQKPSHLRSVLKGVSWRVVGTLDTIFIAFFITGKPLSALTIGGFEVFTKIAFFYLHERIWARIAWGRRKPLKVKRGRGLVAKNNVVVSDVSSQ